MPKLGENLDLSLGSKIINSPAGTAAGDVVNKAQLDALSVGLEWKGEVIAATATPVTISNPGTSTFDGASLTAGNRLLLMGQVTGSQNGIWVFNGSSVALTRPADFASGATLEQGAATLAEGGAGAGQSWVLSGTAAITVDTTAQVWVKFAQITPITAGTGITVTAGVVALATLNGKAAGTITGDGTTTSFTVSHTLGTTDVVVQVKDSAGNWVIVGAQATSTTVVTITFATAPAGAVTYRVVVIG